MNNLHRELAPISAAAWQDLEDQVRDAFALNAGARRVVDVPEPKGPELAAVGTGHLGEPSTAAAGVQVRVRLARPVVELRMPFRVSREAVDSVERGARDPDWAPAVAAAQQMAMAEDSAVFDGLASARTEGLRSGSSHEAVALPSDVPAIPEAVAQARTALRSSGVGGPCALLLSTAVHTAVSGSVLGGRLAIEELSRVVGGDVVWSPALDGGLLVSARGGDAELVLGRDLSIGYLGHDATTIELYLEETFAFQLNTPEAAVELTPEAS
ncbi:bacteriocin [Saccharopolyspora hirsuta]|uniref:Type 1 encapsulin shell protein n=1 Tax=Saccharopolyspora hirsuta TaxID=1837 RepID=A0A5M7BNS0_SACHI|nr:family 1 encapsulin nanocompartment shell protein [Saccharopolyspora hirsuta]KAA5830690.1 bacteriocin [Saccharopolyspora hirsuta]